MTCSHRCIYSETNVRVTNCAIDVADAASPATFTSTAVATNTSQ